MKGKINPQLAAIQDSLRENLPPVSASELNDRPLEIDDSHPIWEFWSRMSDIYGHKWASQHGDEPNDSWIRILAPLDASQYSTGFNALSKRADNWPPDAFEFRNMATGYDPGSWERIGYDYVDATKIEKNSHLTNGAQAAGNDFFTEMKAKGLM